MPRFYFDIREGERFVPDEDGLEFPTVNEARDDASRTLGQMMKEAMPDGQHHDMAVEVRGDDKRPPAEGADHLRGPAVGERRAGVALTPSELSRNFAGTGVW